MNDQVFQPGDKVMLVAREMSPGAESHGPHPNGSIEYSRVYCVTHCWWSPAFSEHRCALVGYPPGPINPDGTPIGFRTANFRKVEEIKLCVEAVRKA